MQSTDGGESLQGRAFEGGNVRRALEHQPGQPAAFCGAGLMWHEDVQPVTVPMGRLVSTAQAGAVLDRSEREVRRMMERGDLDSVRIGRRVYVTRKSVVACGHGRQ